MINRTLDYLSSMDPELAARPIILIGAGRSGSTLFMRMLNSHPQIRFLGETHFLLPRLWRGVWENPRWFNKVNFPEHFRSYPTQLRSSRETAAARSSGVDEAMLDEQRERIAYLLRLLFGDILQLGNDVDAWGYKEIWNGNDAVARYSWDIYNAVFPEATWVHLIRHPFDFLKSIARWNLSPLTKSFLVHECGHWVQMLSWNRDQSTRKKFLEIRYEDLISHPKKTLVPVFSMAGMEWSDDCLGALSISDMQSREASPFSSAPAWSRKELKRLIGKIENLAGYMEELDYDLPETFPREIAAP